MLINLLLNNLSTSLEGPLSCIYTNVSTKLNVYTQNNIYNIHKYVQKSMENCLFGDKYFFSYEFLSRILFSFSLIFGKIFRLVLLTKDLLIEKHARPDLNAEGSDVLAKKTVYV